MTDYLLTKNLPVELLTGRSIWEKQSGAPLSALDMGVIARSRSEVALGASFFYAAFALSLNPFSYQRSHATTSGVVRMCFSGASFRLRFLLLNSSIQAG